jgi:lipopolysaccharide export system protein LptA
LTVTPAPEEFAADPDGPRRFHVIAMGDPVVIRDRKQGEANCQELEYHDETKQVWLRGTAEKPVRTQIGKERELVGKTIFFDRKEGIARMDGPGRMIDQQGKAGDVLVDEREQVDIRWSNGVEITFARMTYEAEDPEGGPPVTKRREYIKSAVFTGNARFAQSDQSITADRVEALFNKPDPGQDKGPEEITAPDRVVAIGHVALTSGTESVTCDRLDAEMALDETGQPYPRIATARGHVVARQGKQEIRARDHLSITTKSIPRPVTEEQRAHYEALAKERDIEPGSPAWLAFEKKLKNRRETVIESMRAKGEVTAADPKSELALRADSLDCTFGKEREISHAFMVGTDDSPAYVDTGEFAIRGPQIIIDTPTQSVDLPGAGMLQFLTQQDLDGQPVDEAIPVTVTWDQRMALRGERNMATFTGEVMARSRNNTMKCNELRIDFRDLPKERTDAEAIAEKPEPSGTFAPLAALWGGDRQESKSLRNRAAQRIRKRPVYVHAIGDAAIESRAYQDLPRVTGGIVSQIWVNNVLEPLLPKDGDQPRATRMVSRLRISGPKIGIDLIQEHLGVEGAGNLLIEDYRLPEKKSRRSASSGGSLASANIGALESSGPSQTGFTWQTSMLYLNNRGIAMFDKDVYMQHAAGSKMVLSQAEAKAMRFDLDELKKIEGREVSMTCDNLLANFERDSGKKKRDGASPLGGATKLTNFRATGQAVRIEQGDYSAQGTLVTYDRSSGNVELQGTARQPSQIMKMDKTGKPYIARSELIKWNQKTGKIYIKKIAIVATGR